MEAEVEGAATTALELNRGDDDDNRDQRPTPEEQLEAAVVSIFDKGDRDAAETVMAQLRKLSLKSLEEIWQMYGREFAKDAIYAIEKLATHVNAGLDPHVFMIGHGAKLLEAAKAAAVRAEACPSRLVEVEQLVCGACTAQFVQISVGLLEIYEQQLYKTLGFDSFAQYVSRSGRLNIALRQAQNLLAAARFMRTLSPTDIVPSSERQVRPLASLPRDEALAAWRRAVDRAGAQQPPTGQLVKQCVLEVTGGEGATRAADAEVKDEGGVRKRRRQQQQQQ